MNVANYLHLIPKIEEWIRAARLDTIVFGMGPTAWLLPWIDQTLLRDIKLWTCHDGFRIMPAQELVLMDPPVRALHPDTSRFDHIVKARPKRIWVINTAWQHGDKGLWSAHLSPAVKGLVHVQRWSVWNPDSHPKLMKPVLGRLDEKGNPKPDTVAVSPAGATTLAWSEGARRIGVIGVDMMKEHHHSFAKWPIVDAFFRSIAEQAHAAGGAIVNLSPITSLRSFKAWNPSPFGSEPTAGSATPEPNASSSTASGSTPPDQSTSTGCDPVIQAGR